MMLQNRYIQPSILHVCIDEKDEFNIKGRVYCPLAKQNFEFYDFSQFLLKSDDLFNEAGYPQAFQKKRNFEGKPEQQKVAEKPEERKVYWTWKELEQYHGKIATYDVLVATRIKSNWQGKIYHANGTEIGSYQDVMQILDYII